MTNQPATGRMLTIGVDSHKDAHVAAAVDQLGRILATTSIPTTPQGFVQLERWASTARAAASASTGSDLPRRRRSCRLGRVTSTTW